MYVSTSIVEVEGEKTIAPVVISNLAWGKYTVTEVICEDGQYIEDLSRFDYTVSGTGDVHVGGENLSASINIINTRREGGSLVISKVASGEFNPETVYEFVLYLSHMRHNAVEDTAISEAKDALETLKTALAEKTELRDTAKALYDSIMAEVVNAEAALELAKMPIEEAAMNLTKAQLDAADAQTKLDELQAKLENAVLSC